MLGVKRDDIVEHASTELPRELWVVHVEPVVGDEQVHLVPHLHPPPSPQQRRIHAGEVDLGGSHVGADAGLRDKRRRPQRVLLVQPGTRMHATAMAVTPSMEEMRR